MMHFDSLRASVPTTALCGALALSVTMLAAAPALAQTNKNSEDGNTAEARNMRLAGYSDLQDRTAY